MKNYYLKNQTNILNDHNYSNNPRLNKESLKLSTVKTKCVTGCKFNQSKKSPH